MARFLSSIAGWWKDARPTWAQLLGFLIISFIITSAISSRYLAYAPPADNLREWFFVRTALVSNVAMLYLLLLMVLLPVVILIPRKRFMIASSIILFWSLHVALLVDVTIYKLFRFHLNGLVWNVMETEGAWDSVTLGTMTWVTFALLAGLLFALTTGAHVLSNWLIAKGYVRLPIAKSIIYLFLFCIGVMVVDKGQFAYADLYNNTSITRHAKLFPLYQPLTIKRFVHNQWGFEVNREYEIRRPAGGVVNYPLDSLRFEGRTPRLNIVVIILDSWRYDMLNPEVTPNVYAFAQRATVFQNHYSGGNATRFGIFGLLYGLYGSYWHSFLAERVGPVLINAYQAQGYQLKVISSTQLTFPEFRKTAFVDIPDAVEDRLAGQGAKERDPALARRFVAWLDGLDTDDAFFAFLLLDAPHAPFSYPEAFAWFEPRVTEMNYLSLDRKKDVRPFLNHYKNALYFDDHVAGTILQGLEDRQLMESTVVIITGDHGEEFYEHGYWGHTSAYSPEQVKVPLVFYLPGRTGCTVDYITSHLDLPATLLDLLGSVNSPWSYSLGSSLMNEEQRREYVVSSGWDDFAVIDTTVTLVFSSETYNIGAFEVRDRDYHLLQDSHQALTMRMDRLREVMGGMARFYQ